MRRTPSEIVVPGGCCGGPEGRCADRSAGQGLRNLPVVRGSLHAADLEDGVRLSVTLSESAELRELKCRNRLLEQENEGPAPRGAYLSQAHLPGRCSTRSSKSWPPTGYPWWLRAGS